MEYKQVILVRADLKMSKGKACAQCAHASVEASLKAQKRKELLFKAWTNRGAKKVVLKEKDLFKFKDSAERSNIITALISDAGHTELLPGTKTTLAIGPDEEEKINKITKDLKPY
jgi:PTH2 family peptidyl-tRNA hydrolase